MLYKDINSSISLSFGTSQRFNISRGIRQGCPISPLLFILAVEMLAILIDKNSNFDKLNVFGRQIGISQLADDTVIVLRDQYQIDKVIQLICLFSKASGLYLNINKCDLIAIHNSELDSYSLLINYIIMLYHEFHFMFLCIFIEAFYGFKMVMFIKLKKRLICF